MGHSNSRMPHHLSPTIVDQLTNQFTQNQVPIDQMSQKEYRRCRRKIERRICRYLSTIYTPEQLISINNSTDGLSEFTLNQRQTLHAIVQDSVTTYLQHRSRSSHDSLHFSRPVSAYRSQQAFHMISENHQANEEINQSLGPRNRHLQEDKFRVRLNKVARTTVVGPAQVGKLPECAICLKEFELEDEMLTLICFHFFHPHCFLAWIKHGSDCPVCRMNLTNLSRKLIVSGKACCDDFNELNEGQENESVEP